MKSNSEPQIGQTHEEGKGYKGFTRKNSARSTQKRRLQEKFLNKMPKSLKDEVLDVAEYLRQQDLRDDARNTSWYTTFPSSLMDKESTYYLPFIPQKYNLDVDTIALNATHPSTGYKQYDTHSLMGHM